MLIAASDVMFTGDLMQLPHEVASLLANVPVDEAFARQFTPFTRPKRLPAISSPAKR